VYLKPARLSLLSTSPVENEVVIEAGDDDELVRCAERFFLSELQAYMRRNRLDRQAIKCNNLTTRKSPSRGNGIRPAVSGGAPCKTIPTKY